MCVPNDGDSTSNGWCVAQHENDVFTIDLVDLPMKNGDLPIKNGDLPIKNGEFP